MIRIAGFATATRVPWLVYVGVPADAAIASSRAHLVESVAVGLSMLFLGLVLSAWLARKISVSLTTLGTHARFIGRGELDHRVEPSNVAEIEVLGSTLNSLAAALEESTQRSKASEAALADLYANAPCGYYSLDGEGRFKRINDTELRWIGRRRDEVLGKHIL